MKTSIQTAWYNMRQRCLNTAHPAYSSYGGRGIRICQRWDSFQNFFEDMEPSWQEGKSLDRIDNEGNYEPCNCRWATAKEQAQNTRQTILTPEMCAYIQRRLKAGIKQKVLMKELNCDRRTIYRARLGVV